MSLPASILLSTTALFLVPASAQSQSALSILLDPVVISAEGGNGAVVQTTAGPVQGYRALTASSATPVNQRVAFDRDRVTGARVTAGMDLGLAIVERLRDRTDAEATQLGAEYAPEPPFTSGTPEMASEHVRAIMDGMFVSFRADVVEVARSVAGARQ